MQSVVVVIAMNQIKEELRKLNPASNTLTSLLEQIVQKQTELVQSLLSKIEDLQLQIDCFMLDKTSLLSQNSQLRRQLQRKEIAQSIEFKQFYAPNESPNESGSKFQRIFERKDAKQTDSKQFIQANSPQNHITQLDLIDYITGQKQKSCSSSNKQARTPILHDPIFKEQWLTSSYTTKGLIRSFYLKLLEHPPIIPKLIDLIQNEYKQNEVVQLFLLRKYPDNKFIGDLIIDFLQGVSQLRNYSQIVQHLNKYQLYDDILTQIFIHSLSNFTEIPWALDRESVKRCFFGLANSFQLELQISQNQFKFYESIAERKLQCQCNENNYQVYEEISLNPRNVKQSISLIHNQIRQPRFTIRVSDEEDCFQFCIKQDKLVEEVQGELIFSQSQNKPRTIVAKVDEQPREFKSSSDDRVLLSKSDQQFRGFSKSGQRAFVSQQQQGEWLVQFDSNDQEAVYKVKSSNNHFADVASILNSSAANQNKQDSQCSPGSASESARIEDSAQLFKKGQRQHQRLNVGSCQSMLLSQYNCRSLYTSKESLRNQFRLEKQNRYGDNANQQAWRSGKKSMGCSGKKQLKDGLHQAANNYYWR